MRVGLEIETCYAGETWRIDDKRGMLKATIDSSIRCNSSVDKTTAIEFVVDDNTHVETNGPPHEAMNDMIKDIKKHIFPNAKACAKKEDTQSTCATHVHMSCNDYTVEDNPFLFFVLQWVWIRKYQKMFTDEFGIREGDAAAEWCEQLVQAAPAQEQRRCQSLNLLPTQAFVSEWNLLRLPVADGGAPRPYHVEFRGMGDFIENFTREDGYMDADKLIRYISLLYKFFVEALTTDVTTFNFGDGPINLESMSLSNAEPLLYVIRNHSTVNEVAYKRGNQFSNEAIAEIDAALDLKKLHVPLSVD